MKCKTPGCGTVCGTVSQERGGYCIRCRKCRAGTQAGTQAPIQPIEAALDKPPSIRTRHDWEAVRDHHKGLIDAQTYCAGPIASADLCQYNAAVDALAKLPVSIDPLELKRLQERDLMLRLIENEARTACRDRYANVGEVLLKWFRTSSILRGQRL